MKLAFLILAHTDVKQLNKLISSIDPSDDIYVHVDLKSGASFVNAIKRRDNVTIIPDQFNIFWGGINMVDATLALISSMLGSKKKYGKVVLLSGLDYPIKSAEYIHEYLNNSINYIRAFNISEYSTDAYRNQVSKFHYTDSKLFKTESFGYRVTRKLLLTFKNSRFSKSKSGLISNNDNLIPIYEGSQWWALNQDFLEYVDSFVKTKSGQEFKEQFRFFLAPDEKFFHTIFFNSKFALSNLKAGPEAFPWSYYQKFRGTSIENSAPTSFFHNLHIIHPSLSKTYTILDYERIKPLLKQKDNLFIRKIETEKSDSLVSKF